MEAPPKSNGVRDILSCEYLGEWWAPRDLPRWAGAAARLIDWASQD
jgi:hypothetical protein